MKHIYSLLLVCTSRCKPLHIILSWNLQGGWKNSEKMTRRSPFLTQSRAQLNKSRKTRVSDNFPAYIEAAWVKMFVLAFWCGEYDHFFVLWAPSLPITGLARSRSIDQSSISIPIKGKATEELNGRIVKSYCVSFIFWRISMPSMAFCMEIVATSTRLASWWVLY